MVLIAAAGCTAGARLQISAEGARYPISMSGALPGPDAEILILGGELEAVGELTVVDRAFGFLYGLTGSRVDISGQVNRDVEAAGGEGVVQLSVRVSHCAHNWLWPLTMFPLFPGCEKVQIEGVIVRRASPAPVTARDPGRSR